MFNQCTVKVDSVSNAITVITNLMTAGLYVDTTYKSEEKMIEITSFIPDVVIEGKDIKAYQNKIYGDLANNQTKADVFFKIVNSISKNRDAVTMKAMEHIRDYFNTTDNYLIDSLDFMRCTIEMADAEFTNNLEAFENAFFEIYEYYNDRNYNELLVINDMILFGYLLVNGPSRETADIICKSTHIPEGCVRR